MKTILMPLFHGFQSRNIIRTDAIKTIINDTSIRLVILVPEFKAFYYQKEFNNPNIIIEKAELVKKSKLNIFWNFVAKNFYNNRTIYWRQEQRLYGSGNRIVYIISRLVTFICRFGGSSFIRKMYSLSANKDHFTPFIKKYDPDLVFLPDIYAPDDVILGLTAQSYKIKCIGMVRSWDNITSKGLCLIMPDKIAVNNEIIKKEANDFIGLTNSAIEVVGVPQFDYYVNYTPTPKKNFFKKLGLNENDKYVLFVPYLGSYAESSTELVAAMDKAIQQKLLPEDLKIIIRMPLSYSPQKTEVYSSERVLLDFPGTKFGTDDKTDWELGINDMIHFADSLYYAQVVINSASTLTVDAAAMNRPSITIMFDLSKKEFVKSLKQMLCVNHFDAIRKSGGTAMAVNFGKLIDQINEYIRNPDKDKKGRERMVREQCWKLDGKSGDRLGNFILKELP